MNTAKIEKNSLKTLLRWIGISLIGFTIYFYWTGTDEITGAQGIWFFGLGISGILFSIGLLAFLLSLTERFHKLLFGPIFMLCFSLIMTVIGVTRF